MSGPRLLLFGLSGAGKSALVGALAQVAATQPAALKGSLIDASGQWNAQHQRTYDGKLTPTEAITAYDLRLQPTAGPTMNATIVDSSGASAQAMVASSRPFAEANLLNKPLLDADTVLVLVDASMPAKELNAAFQQCGVWLTRFHELRGRRTEVANLPIYVVLTKCDLLARPDDTFGMWMQRIEEGKRRVDQKFRDMLKEQGIGFGTIQLHVWATSIRRPALADRPAKTHEPFGVAELFRQCLRSAQDYRDRRIGSRSYLLNILVGLTGLVAMLALVVTLLAEYRPATKHVPLEEEVQAVLPRRPEDRLHASIKRLEEKRDRLRKIQRDPEFTSLSSLTQKAALRYRDELDHYLGMYEDTLAKIKSPHLAKNEEEFLELKKNLDAFHVPEVHAKDWADTRLVGRVNRICKEFQVVDQELKEEQRWIRAQIKQNNVVLKEGTQIYSKLLENQKLKPQEAEVWNQEYRNRMQPKPRKPRDENLPGTHLTYEDLDRFGEVRKAAKEWSDSKAQLKRMADNIQDQLKGGT